MFIYDDGWPANPDKREHFVYDDWNVVMVLDGLNSNATTRKYTWGLDLSGTIHGAGGIGGLLACEEPQAVGDPTRYWFFYDGNGNVVQVTDVTSIWDPTFAARYEYDPYGNPIPIPQPPGPGPYADLNPFRFSTKWFDAETGLGNWTFRYYSPRLGRWISRDPIGEWGGLSLYEFVGNDPIGLVDPDGLKASCCCAKNVTIGNNKRWDTRQHWGTTFDVTITLEYKGDSKDPLTDCRLEWHEKTDLPYTPGMAAGQWTNMYSLASTSNSSTFGPWNKRKKSPIPGAETVVITDTPALAKWPGRNAERTLYFAITVRGGQSEECAKMCNCEASNITTGAIANGSVTAYATQYLKMVNGKGDTETFSLGIPPTAGHP